MRVLIRTAATITDREQEACFALWDDAFPQPAGQTRPPDFAEPTTTALLIDDDTPAASAATGNVLVRDEVATLVAACRLRDRVIMVAGVPVRVAGLASIAVVEAHRRRGLGTWLVHLATDTARVHGYGWSVLFCSPHRQGFYHRLGWQSLAGDLRVGPPTAAHPINPAEDAAMALPLTQVAAANRAAWRGAPIVFPDYW